MRIITGVPIHFNKRAKAPFHYNLLRHLGEMMDGITGLLMIPFGRYGTQFGYTMSVKTLRWQSNEYRKDRDNGILRRGNVSGQRLGCS